MVYKKKPKAVKESTRKKKKKVVYESDTQSISDEKLPRQEPQRTRKRRQTFYDEPDFGIKFVFNISLIIIFYFSHSVNHF